MSDNLLKAKKLLIVSPSQKIGGIERALSVLANAWVKQGFSIVYVSCLKSEPFYHLDPKIKVIEPNFIRGGGITNKAFFYPKLVHYIRSQIKREQPDRILSFGDFFNPLVLLAAIGLKIPVYISDRTSHDFKFPSYINILKKHLYPRATGFIAQTPRAYEAKKTQFGSQFNQTIIPNAIRIIKKNNVPKEQIILYIGRLSWEKNPIALIKAFAQIEDKVDWKLVMAGNGPQLEEMKVKASRLGLHDNILFLGAVADVDEWLNKASLFVLPSVLEGFPNALCEAMAAGLPVICFDSIAYESIITPGFDGEVVNFEDIDLLSQKIFELMTNPEKRSLLGKRAVQKANDWTVDNIIHLYNQFLRLNEHL